MSTDQKMRLALQCLMMMASDELSTTGMWAHSRASWDAAIAAARAALLERQAAQADEPAVPKGREPAGGFIDPDIAGQDRVLLEAFYAAALSEGGTADEVNLRGIRAALAAAPQERQAAIVPVPVSEQPWDREGWCDEQGRCWFFDPCDHGWWWLRSALFIDGDPAPLTHCLPAHALPLPSGEGEVEAP